MSLRTRFILTFGIGGVLFLLVVTILVFSRMESVLHDQLKHQFDLDSKNRISNLNYSFNTFSQQFRSSARLPMFRSMRFHQLTLNQAALKNDVRQLELYFVDWINQNKELTKVRYINKFGAEVLRVENTGIKKNLSDMSYNKVVSNMLKLQKGKIGVSIDSYNNKIKNIVWWVPIYISNGDSYGVMSFSLSYQYIIDNILSLLASESEYVCLDDSHDNVFFTNDSGKTCHDESSDHWQVNEKVDLPLLNWELSLSIDPDVLLSEVSQLRNIVFFIIFPFVAVISFVLSYVFSNNIIVSIGKLVEAARTMGRGVWLQPIVLGRDDELNDLANEINRSAEMIENHRDELQQKNRDLDAYSYTLAHDLRAPLRSISSFSQILEIDAKDKLADDELDALTRIIKASQRMSALIDDILELSRISNREIKVSELSLSDMIESIAGQIRETNVYCDASINIEKDVSVKGDAQLLRLVFENLLGNACKYSQKEDSAKVDFGVIYQAADGESKSSTIYYVRDNGIGFNMKYVDKLFKPFQRLHKSSDFEGTGIGLASVKRMIERHEGRVWIKSAMNVGTTVFFTLWEYPDDSVVESDLLP